MKTKLAPWSLAFGLWLSGGCMGPNLMQITDLLPADKPKGYVEFYAENGDTLHLGNLVLEITASNICHVGTFSDDKRLRVACPPGRRTFLDHIGGQILGDGSELMTESELLPMLKLMALSSKSLRAVPVAVEVKDGMISPVKVIFTIVAKLGPRYKYTVAAIPGSPLTMDEYKSSAAAAVRTAVSVASGPAKIGLTPWERIPGQSQLGDLGENVQLEMVALPPGEVPGGTPEGEKKIISRRTPAPVDGK